MHILFVENHATFATTVVSEFLKDDRVLTVATVAHAHDALLAREFDVLLVDFDLDGAKGDTFVREIRTQGFDGPIVAVSARDDGNDALVSAGADAVCHKAKFRHIHEAIALAQKTRAHRRLTRR